MRHVGLFSGGLGSWFASKRMAARHGTADMVLLFTDTLTEDEDLYRFLPEAAANVGAELVRVADGRDIWQVFHDERYLGNTRKDPCSKILKRKAARDWLAANRDPADTVVHVGIGWQEAHRFHGRDGSPGFKGRMAGYGWACEAPLCDEPHVTAAEVLAAAEREGLTPPRLYDLGYAHNNCGGFCMKAGQAQFRLLLKTQPERYAYHEAKEQELREFLGKDVAVLRDRRGGVTRPLPMAEFRRRVERDAADYEPGEHGGCNCFAGEED